MNGVDNPPAPEVVEEIRSVVGRAKNGDISVLPRLRELLTQHPALWVHYGNLAGQTEAAWVVLAAGQDLHLRECLLRRAASLREELAGPSPSPVEKLLVERVVATWLQLHYFDAIEAQALNTDEKPRLATSRAKRQEQAHRMYLTSLAALTTLRKLLPGPPVIALPSPKDEPPPAPERIGRCNGHAATLPNGINNRLSGYFDEPPVAKNGQHKREMAEVGADG